MAATDSALDAPAVANVRGGARTQTSAFEEVRQGEIVALLDTSGCSNGTPLRAIAGLETHYTDRIRHDASRTSFVFHEPRLMPWLTVAENVSVPLGHAKERSPRVLELLEEVGLSHAANYYPKQLSGGMAQRAAIARALVSRPDLLVLDNPFSALDALTKGRLHRLVRDLVRRYRIGAVFITHEPDEALALASRVLVPASEPGPICEEIDVGAARSNAERLASRDGIPTALIARTEHSVPS